jgi:hypothetical protein
MRRLNLCAFSLTTAGLMALAVVTPAAAADRKPIDVSATARVISMPSPTGAAVPNTSYAGLDETNVTVGIATGGVPCGNCVGGAGTPNIGLPWPIFSVSQGQTLTISTWFEATTYTGPCTAGLIVKQGATIVATATYPFPGGCNAGYLYGVFFDLPVPTTTGFTTVIGSVTGGPNKSGSDTFLNVQ